MELDNSPTVYRLVPQNNGFGFAPVTVTYEEKFDYTPIFCSMDHHVSSREIGLLYRDSSSLSPATRQFIQTAREVIPSFVRSEILILKSGKILTFLNFIIRRHHHK